MIRHRADAGVRPDILCRLDHIDDGIDRKDEPHDADRRADTAHERERQEVASHRYARIADSGEYCDDEPCEHGRHRKLDPRILHDEERSDQYEGCASVHVDGRADRKHEARNRWIRFKILLCRGQRDRECACRALGEESDRNGGRHFLENIDRIQSAGQEEERQDEEELDPVAGHDDERVFPERPYDDPCFDLGRELTGKSQNADRKNGEKRFDQRKEELLKTKDALQEDFAILRLRHEGKPEAEGGGDQHDSKYIAGQEWLQNVIRNDIQDVVIVGDRSQLLRHARSPCTRQIRRQISRRHPEIHRKPDARCKDGGEKRVDDCVCKNAAGFLLAAESSQCRDDSERDRRYRDELEQTGEYRRDKIKELIQRLDPKPAQGSPHDQCQNPENKLPSLLLGLVLFQHALC